MKFHTPALLAILLLVGLTGCGSKGSLTLPKSLADMPTTILYAIKK